jgi:hypothetical protein
MKIFRNNPIKYILLVAVVLLSSCSKFGDLNTDPTKSSNINPENQLIFAQLWFSGDLSTQERTNSIVLMPMMQQLGAVYYARVGGMYIKDATRLWVMWENSYQNDVVNIVDAVERTKNVSSKTNLNAICRIMKVYTFARLTDLYGDIPYSQAGSAYYTQVKRPVYDTQKDIYDNFLQELKAASAQLDPAKDVVANEIFYKGNITAWKKFANSLRIRLALRLAKRDKEKATKEIQEAYQADGGVMTSNTDICMTRHLDIQNNYTDLRGNSVSVAINQQSGMPKIIATFLNQLKNTNDPRINYIPRCYKQNSPLKPFDREDITAQLKASSVGLVGSNPGKYVYDDWVGPVAIKLANGTNYNAVNGDIKCELNTCFIRNNAPFLHLTYAELELSLADASVRLGITLGDDAATHYRKGVEAAMKQLSLYPGGPVIPDAEIADFITQHPLQAGTELKQINHQLWIALMLNGPEIFANWRRSGFPELQATPNNESTATSIPRRFQYPLSEKEQNATNVQRAIAIIGEDDWQKRVWWDKE